jgi:2-methylcitrate dehydratase
MDRTTEYIAAFVEGLTPDRLTPNAGHEAKRRLVDSLACAFGAVDSPPAAIARALARDVSGTMRATAVGLPQPTTVEMAAFANTAMVRYLDYNDYYRGRRSGGHPSDMIPAALAVGQALGAAGRDVLAAIVAAYEVAGGLFDAVNLRERGWDQGLFIVIGSAVAAGKLLGLSRGQIGHAVSLAATANIPTRQTRVGHLSMWKGCATAFAVRNGIFSALLAGRGMIAPLEPFEGGDALWQLVTGPFELALPVSRQAFAVEQIHTKFRPLEAHAQGPVHLLLSLRDRIPVEALERLDVETYWLTWSEIGSEPEKWDPRTRETADHSLPYLLGVALVDGEIGAGTFALHRIADPALRPIMQRIRIAERKDFTARFPGEFPCRMTATLRDGTRVTGEIAHPPGHMRNPLSDAQLDEKFDRMLVGRSGHDVRVARMMRDHLWRLETVPNIAQVLAPLGDVRAA